MASFISLFNLFRYGTMHLLPQVDPNFVRPIFEGSLRRVERLYPEDTHLKLSKPARENLFFQYTGKNGELTWLSGAIYAKLPRQHFGGVDIISFMDIAVFQPGKLEFLLEAVRQIVKTAGIEHVIAERPDVDQRYVVALERLHGERLPTELKYGILRT